MVDRRWRIASSFCGLIAEGEDIDCRMDSVYNVSGYGAVPNDSTKGAANLGAVNDVIAAIDANGGAGTIYFPAGTWYLSDGFTLTTIGMNVRGAGHRGTTLIVANSASYAIRLGTVSVQLSARISEISVDRTGTPPTDSIGIYAYNYSYVVLEDVDIRNHYDGIKTANNSLGLGIHRVLFSNITHRSLWIQNCAEVRINDSTFGRNGDTLAPSDAFIVVDGGAQTNDLRVHGTQFLGQPGGTLPPTAALKWINTAGSPGYSRFVDCNIENVDTAFASDSHAPFVSDMEFIGGRITVNGPLAKFDAATDGHIVLSLTTLDFVTPTTIGPMSLDILDSPFIRGQLTVNGGYCKFAGNTLFSTAFFTGTFPSLKIGETNILIGGSVIDTAGATVTGGASTATACAYRSANLSIPDSTLTPIPFTVERWDTNSMHSVSSNPERFVCITPGYYTFSGSARFATNGTGQRKLLVYFQFAAGGSGYISPQTVSANASNPIDVTTSRASWYMNPGDWVELHAFQSSGGALNLEATTGLVPEFSIARLP
jgi:hypothetical protein